MGYRNTTVIVCVCSIIGERISEHLPFDLTHLFHLVSDSLISRSHHKSVASAEPMIPYKEEILIGYAERYKENFYEWTGHTI